MRGPTSHDVARLAGVSQPTVSRGLRDDPIVSVKTRRRIREAAAQLGYVPSRRGRSLSTRDTGHVAIVVSDLGNPFYMEAVEHLHREFDRVGVRVVVLTDVTDRPPSAEALLDGSIDGVVLTTTQLGSALPGELARRGLPVVLFNRATDGPGVDTCSSENHSGARAVAVELASLGHTRIGAILGPQDTSTGRDREAGFRTGLAELGLALPDVLVRRGEFSFAAGRRGLQELWTDARPPTAIFCANDVIALGVLDAARGLGIDVPGALTVVGFDDIAMAAWQVFSLTTVRQDLPAMAVTVQSLLMERVAHPDVAPRHIVVPTAIVRRASHGSPAR